MREAKATTSELFAALEAEGVSARQNVSGARYNTFSIGGALQCLVEPESTSLLQKTMALFELVEVSPIVLGFGSNSIFSDAGVRTPVIRLGQGFRHTEYTKGTLCRVGAATSLMTLSRKASEMGLSGLEFAGGIPGSVGGAIRMNAGAHGSEICEVLKSVTFVTRKGELVTARRDDLSFSYRQASIPTDAIIVEAELEFTASDRESTQAARQKHLQYRKDTQPLTLPSAGSTFRNPTGEDGVILPAGKVLEELGLKGERRGGAMVSQLHANWIVNPEREATASDVRELIEFCQQVVREQKGLELRPEVVIFEDQA